MGDILGRADWVSFGAVCFAHPLRFSASSAVKFVRQIKGGSGAGLVNMAVMPVSTPVTLEGFIVVVAAEFLALWLAGRAMRDGVKVGGSLWTGTTDMVSGRVNFAAFDAMLYSFAAVEFIERWTGKPIRVGGGEYCDARVPGYFALCEKAYKAMTIAAFSGRHPSLGYGLLEAGQTICPAQMLLECDYSDGLRHYARTVQPTEENIALSEIIDACLNGWSLLESDHTVKHFRDCVYLPRLLDRLGYGGGEHDRVIVRKAQDKIKQLLAAYRKPAVDPAILARMRAVADRAKKYLA
jgi:trimethylamine:corrinoid methyltransferase-like protein